MPKVPVLVLVFGLFVALALMLTFVSFVNMLELCKFLQFLPEKMKQFYPHAM